LKEFGGWGLRYGKLGAAYTTRGKYILHIKTQKKNTHQPYHRPTGRLHQGNCSTKLACYPKNSTKKII
jgi:hypothetical protein